MCKIFEWLCPKRKPKREAYDVHEDTFEMDENIGDLESPAQPDERDEEPIKEVQSHEAFHTPQHH